MAHLQLIDFANELINILLGKCVAAVHLFYKGIQILGIQSPSVALVDVVE